MLNDNGLTERQKCVQAFVYAFVDRRDGHRPEPAIQKSAGASNRGRGPEDRTRGKGPAGREDRGPD